MLLKRLVNDKELWDSFLEEIESRIEKERSSMENISDTVELYRHQGSIKALRRLKYLREHINGAK
jgi:hypothetical protein